jgi:carbon-monoxide dehydrogenase large subunit
LSGPATGEGIGQPVRRKEDLRLVVGQGRYSDDLNLPGQAYAVMVRSPHAHARIRGIAAADALRAPGVVAVLTGAELLADDLRPIPQVQWSGHPAEVVLRLKDGAPALTAPQYPMPADKARFVGEAVAMVIAETPAAAKDGAERVVVDYEPLPAVTDGCAAAAPDAPRIWEHMPSNICVDAETGDAAATAAAFARAAHVVRFTTQIQRVNGVPMEPRAAIGEFDPASGRYTLHAGSGTTVRLKHELATVLGVTPDRVRAVMRDVGGNFGTRGGFYPEFALVAWAARRVGRPVKWTCERQEAFLCDYQGRDLHVDVELALDRDGRFLAMRGSNLGNIGAHTASFSSLQKGVEIMSGLYHVPAAHFHARAVVSNTPPTRPYRSAGRPEVIYVMERLIDLAARECGFDRVELRRRNLVSEAAMPYRNPFGLVYDNGAYGQALEQALALGDWGGFAARSAASRRRGRCRGIGIATYVDTATGVTRERAEVTVRPEGEIELVIGTISNGQGHETSFAQLISEFLGVPHDRVRLVMGDTDRLVTGGGSHSGRSMRLAAIIVKKASDEIIAKGLRIASHLLETAAPDLEFVNGRYRVKGTDRSIGLFEVAAAARERNDLPEDLRRPLDAVSDENVTDASFPYGSHVCEVEVDPDTGRVYLDRYAAVDDVGRAVNPMIVDGQTHGGAAQGIGQALLEQCRYDDATGQLLSGSFMDYAMPRADMLPSFATEISEVPSTTHPLGLRAAGEGGTTPALGAVVNAVADALAGLGVRHVEMPVTPERVWRAIREAEGRP